MLQTREHTAIDICLFADHRIVLVVRVVSIPHLTIGSELELEELVAEFALVAFYCWM